VRHAPRRVCAVRIEQLENNRRRLTSVGAPSSTRSLAPANCTASHLPLSQFQREQSNLNRHHPTNNKHASAKRPLSEADSNATSSKPRSKASKLTHSRPDCPFKMKEEGRDKKHPNIDVPIAERFVYGCSFSSVSSSSSFSSHNL
jgi:hypothetical protein